MSKIIKSHFYIVKGTPKGKLFPTVGWTFHSFQPIEQFAPIAAELCQEYDIEIDEIFYTESQIIGHWNIPADHWS